MMRRLRGFRGNRDGATAIEFAIVALPLFLLIFAIIEASTMFFINATLDAAVDKASRKIRTGQAIDSGMTLKSFKASICSDMLFSFDCTDNLRVRVDILSDMSASAFIDPIDTSGKLTVTESFKTGGSGSYMLVQAFLPWNSVLDLFTISGATLSNGDYLLGAAALFRNEPF